MKKEIRCVGEKKKDNLINVQRASYFYQGTDLSDDAFRYSMQTFIFPKLSSFALGFFLFLSCIVLIPHLGSSTCMKIQFQHFAQTSILVFLEEIIQQRDGGNEVGRVSIRNEVCQGVFTRRIPTCCFSQVLCFFLSGTAGCSQELRSLCETGFSLLQ